MNLDFANQHYWTSIMNDSVPDKTEISEEFDLEEIGTLNLPHTSIKFTHDMDNIYGNRKHILFNYNDQWTAVGVFSDLMAIIYGDKWKPAE